MKNFTKVILIFCLSFSFVNAQTILVNNNVISVQNDVTFPLWLDSMSTIEIGTQVVSISALEFNIVPTNNGNSLVFSQTKTITSQETVPNGMTWKITAVLLDSTTLNNSSSNGSGQVIVSGSGGIMPVALSNESASTMQMGDAMLYCDNLQEGGYDNWVVPTWEEMMFLIGGGIDFVGTRNNNQLWTSTFSTKSPWEFKVASTQGDSWANSSQDFNYIRCVRHESISISSSGSSSGGSNSASTLGNNMPTMISNESVNTMFFYEAMIYCDSLNEFGHSDWVLPNFDQLSYAISGGCVINDARSQEYIWSRSYMEDTADAYLKTIKTSGTYTIQRMAADDFISLKCRCVR